MGTRGGTLPGLLDPIRTLFEKLSALHAAAIAEEAGNSSSMARAGRHYYDVHALLVSQGLIERLSEVSIEDMMADIADIADVSTRNGWPFHPRPKAGFASSPALAPHGQAVDHARVSYEAALGLIYSEPPTFESCLATIGMASAHPELAGGVLRVR